MVDWVHSFWQQVVLWYQADPVPALLCLLVGLAGICLWIELKKWGLSPDCRPVMSAMDGRRSASVQPDSDVAGPPLVLEWEVRTSERGIGDIGDLEQRLLRLRSLGLDAAYDVVVSLCADEGTSDQRVAEILTRRFPGVTFVVNCQYN